MTKVAADYGISDVALKKICDKHRIPVPGRGYRAEKVAGKTVKRTHFRAVTDPTINRVVIHGSPVQDLPNVVKEAKEAAKGRERHSEKKVEVAAVPDDLHPRVARTGRKLEKAKPAKTGLVKTSGPDLFDLEVGPDSVGRVIAFLNALLTATEERGCRIVKGKHALVFIADDEILDFKIVEQTRRSKHERTAAELAAIEKWERRRRLGGWDHIYWTPRPTPPEWDCAPNGHLRIVINEQCRYGYEGLRRTFGDGRTQRIETLINLILEAFRIWLAAIKAKRIEDERRQLEWEEAERWCEEQRRRDALEKKRIEALSQDLEQWHQRKRILAFVATVEGALATGGYENAPAVQEWISWAKDYADRIDPLSGRLPGLPQFEDFQSWELHW